MTPLPAPTEIDLLPTAAAADISLMGEIADLINLVYAETEAGIWIDGTARTTRREVIECTAAGELAIARRAGELAGCVRLHVLDGGQGEFGMLAAAPRLRGQGIGRDLVAFAEWWGRRSRLPAMRLELLVPRTWSHPAKEFLRAWYTRSGYRAVARGDIGGTHPRLADLLATPCDLLVYEKRLPGPAR